ncbi:aminomethyl-transferring glycine dehydrogenase subunit GcvPB [Clostridium kluyveri]|uniref:Probable glycine dehydrogenase (decarboxylating) subunit 2 n=1 Tax=Clostridium kluyveri TaxID=1534 RepID=A0A1L5F848_CLOKL|nr:aminomethyl-transferring glycine dehydrogenase subunit GcvPB [Clostridium kluyveri]APM39185.1 glycine dehydrogenase (aminomethyl-transferring) [Clostridium kluyveri]UZQ51514.1 aminomethyl-transferring glycine dehydrogenase subunit GcvPB [Clostridium kluyveri]
MKLLFEKGNTGRKSSILPENDVPSVIPNCALRQNEMRLPGLSESEISRHYSSLAKRAHGVNDGFYPLGSCTMKYNPKINEETASLSGFTKIHPLQPENTVQGCLKLLYMAEKYLCEITGMDAMTMQPAAGAHGEFTGLLLIKAYHESRNDEKRDKIIVPDSAHGTNPASAAMAGFKVISIPSGKDGCVDIVKLKEVLGEDTAGLMLTNPNTLGLFDKNILEITKMVHEAGGLNYYDGANLNAVMGIVRPGDMGFDVIHINLHKTFSAPHGGGGPGSGPVGCKDFLKKFLPGKIVVKQEDDTYMLHKTEESIGDVKSFYGNFQVVVKALTYIIMLGKDGILETAENAVLNANYMRVKLSDRYDVAYDRTCMHEFVVTMKNMKKEHGVLALDIAKALLDYGVHPPTIYFPLIVHEALMIEPTETETKETLDEAISVFKEIYKKAEEAPEKVHEYPYNTVVRRPDEVLAATKPKLQYYMESKNNTRKGVL